MVDRRLVAVVALGIAAAGGLVLLAPQPTPAPDEGGTADEGEAPLRVPAALWVRCEPTDDPATDDRVHAIALEFLHLGNAPGDPIAACGGHKGHHTYDLGGVASVTHVRGRILTTEADRAVPLGPDRLLGGDLEAELEGIPLATSLDGRTWTRIGLVAYHPDDPDCSQPGHEVNCLQIVCSAPQCEGGLGVLADRQGIDLEFAIEPPVEARFVRLSQPATADGALAGYLDFSDLTLNVSAFDGSPSPQATGPLSLSCERDILEDFFADHPCWFGLTTIEPVAPLSSASVLHTYPVGNVTVTGVSGSASFAPYRAPGCDTESPVTSFRVEARVGPKDPWRILARFDDVPEGPSYAFEIGPFVEPASLLRIASDGCGPAENPKAKSLILESTLVVETTS